VVEIGLIYSMLLWHVTCIQCYVCCVISKHRRLNINVRMRGKLSNHTNGELSEYFHCDVNGMVALTKYLQQFEENILCERITYKCAAMMLWYV
jgi:hypothetical protein